MRWPPNKSWTSNKKKKGYRHFEVLNYGGRSENRWVELYAVVEKNIRIKVTWEEMNNSSKWQSGWITLPTDGS